MPTIQELREKRTNIWAQAQEFNARHAKGEEMSPEDETSWQRALADIDELGTKIENRERTETLDKRFSEIDEQTRRDAAGGGTPDATSDDQAYRSAFDSYVRRGLDQVSPEQRAMLLAAHVDLESRAQGTATGGAGGYTVPEGFWAKVTETMKFYAQVTALAEVINTSQGNRLPWPTNDDTSNEGALLDENPSSHTELDLTFGQANLDAYTYTSKLVRASLQLLQDSAVDAEGLIARKLGVRLGRITNRHYTVGTGSSQPQGYITGATTGKTAASPTAFTWEEMVDLVHSVDVAYRSNATWALHDLVLAVIRKMKDDENRPLWQPSIAADVPDKILGYDYFVNNYQASAVAASAKTLAFGDFQAGFVIRNVQGGQLMRLGERYAELLQVGFFGFLRTDSVVQDASAIKVLVQAAS